MTNDEMFQAFERLRNADVGHVSVDNFERLRSEMRTEMMSKRHRSWQGLTFFKFLATMQPNGKNYWENNPRDHGFSWEYATEIYTEWKMLEDDDFWAAVHHA